MPVLLKFTVFFKQNSVTNYIFFVFELRIVSTLVIYAACCLCLMLRLFCYLTLSVGRNCFYCRVFIVYAQFVNLFMEQK